MSHSFLPSGHSSGPPSGRVPEPLVRAIRRLDALVDWERRDRAPFGVRVMRVDLAPMRDLGERLGAPWRAWSAVHVAGSKGKGSVASLIASGLARAGWRVGVYASPHVERVNERIRIAGAWIGDEPLAAALERALDARAAAVSEGTPGAGATWFDVVTAAAYLAFAEAGVDLAVVECGLGGRLDSTNVIRAPLCVLTSIELEHVAILGPTRAAIAAEKLGIVHPGAVCVSGVGAPGDEACDAIAAAVPRQGARLVHVPRDSASSMEQQNAALAARALDELGALVAAGRLTVPERATAAGVSGALLDAATVAAARLPGRLERARVEGHVWILDGAHTPGSMESLLRDLARPGGPGRPSAVVLGLGRDKDAEAVFKVLRGRVDSVVCTSPGPGPYHDPEALASVARGPGRVVETAACPETAFQRAQDLLPPEGFGLVTGSLHLVGALRRRIVRQADPCSPSSPT